MLRNTWWRPVRSVSTPRLALHTRAPYHTYDHPVSYPYSHAANTILQASLKLVPAHGFTQQSLRLGARDAGYLSVSANLFPQGVFDLIIYYLISKRAELHAKVSNAGLVQAWQHDDISLPQRLLTLIKARLQMNQNCRIVERWPEALAIMTQPNHLSQSLAELGRLADDFCFLAGDDSVDTAWYTKRAALASLYAAAELYHTQDSSPGCVDTMTFVNSRFADLQSTRSGLDAAAEWFAFSSASFVNVLRSKGLRI